MAGILRASWGWMVLKLGLSGYDKQILLRARGCQCKSRAIPIPIWSRVLQIEFCLSPPFRIITLLRDLRQTTGSEHAELAFLIVGALTILVGTLPLSFVLDFFLAEMHVNWVAPFRIIFFSLVVAYAIASRKIMEVGLFFRRATGYLVLTAYLLALYFWSVAAATVFHPFEEGGRRTFASLAAIVKRSPRRRHAAFRNRWQPAFYRIRGSFLRP